MTDNARSRGWCFTINNPTDDDRARCINLADDSVYCIVGNEVGAQGTPHFQGYVYFKTQRTFTSVKKKLPRANIQAAKGNPEQNKKYCEKDGNLIIEKGSPPSPGTRSDISDVRTALQEGKGMQDIVELTDSFQAIRFAEKYLTYREKKRNWKTEVFWVYGGTALGKTTRVALAVVDAKSLADDDVFVKTGDDHWWDGYDSHPKVIIDDMRKDFCKFHILLQLLDQTPVRIQNKGGSRQLLAKKLCITTSRSPWDMYETREDVNQLARRCAKIIHVKARDLYAVTTVDEFGEPLDTRECTDVSDL